MFVLGEFGVFMFIVEIVQKIVMDEFIVYVEVGKYVIRNECIVDCFIKSFKCIELIVYQILLDIIKFEIIWNNIMFSGDDIGIVGIIFGMFEDWIYYGLIDVYNMLGFINFFCIVIKNFLLYMDSWFNINNN